MHVRELGNTPSAGPIGAEPATDRGRAEEYRAASLWRGRTLSDELRSSTSRFADLPALVTAEVRWTYAEMSERVEAFAAGILALTPLRPGDRVMFQMGNVAETVIAYYGAVRAGLVPVCTLPQHREREISALASHTGARAHIVQGDFRSYDLTGLATALRRTSDVLDVLLIARGPVPEGAVAYADLLAAGETPTARAALARVRTDVGSPVAFQLSGGTTGLPKVAPRYHEEYVCNALSWARMWSWGPGHVVMHPLPIMHNAGIAAAMQPAHLSGATFVLAPGADIGTAVGLIASERVTALPVVPPAIAIRLLDYAADHPVDLSSVRQFIVGGQKLPGEVFDQLEDRLGLHVLQMFGMAEGMFFATPASASHWARRSTVGAPISTADEARVCEIGTDEQVPDGEVGELCCRGPYTITGYYRAPEHNLTQFTAEGYYRTGDLAIRHRVDGATCYSIEGRIKDVINRGAEKIHAEEVEECILAHPDVHAAALVAMPDRVLGERACAFLIPAPRRPAPSLPELAEFLLSQGLAKYKLPERVEVVSSFPLTHVGKVSKKSLRTVIAAKIVSEQNGQNL